MKKFLAAIFILLAIPCLAQTNTETKINPLSQIQWSKLSGTGTPDSSGFSCTTNYGQPYTDQDTPHYYICTASGWYQIDGGGSSVTSLNDLSGSLSLTSSDSSITITPSGSTINLQAVGSSSNVQYNPTTTAYIIMSSSILYDDNRVTSSAVPVSTWTCNGTDCIVTATSAHNLTSNDWVDLSSMTGWFTAPTNRGTQDTGIGSFKVLSTGLTSTQFEVAYATNTGSCSSSCGNVYSATNWGIYTAAAQPFLADHGTTYGVFSYVSNAATNFSSVINCSLGSPTYLILESGLNDVINGNNSASTVETNYQSVWKQAHEAGCIVVQGSLLPTSMGIYDSTTYWSTIGSINEWLSVQGKTFTNSSSSSSTYEEYWDKFIDFNSYGFVPSYQMVGNNAQGSAIFGERVNEAFASQGGSLNGPPPIWQTWVNGEFALNMPESNFVILNQQTPFVTFHSFNYTGTSSYLEIAPTAPGYAISSYTSLQNTFSFSQANQEGCNTFEYDGLDFDQFNVCLMRTTAAGSTNYFDVETQAHGIGHIPLFKVFGSGAIQFPYLTASNGTEPLEVDSSGNVLVGNSSAYVQSSTDAWNSGSTVTLAYSSNVSAGNLLIVSYSSEGAVTSSTVSDTLGTTYTRVAQITSATINMNVWAGIAPSSGANTVTIGSPASAYNQLGISEYRNVSATADVTASNYTTSNTTASASIINTNSTDLIYGITATDQGNNLTYSSPFTLTSLNNAVNTQALGYTFTTSATTSTLTSTTTSGNTPNQLQVLIAFKDVLPSQTFDTVTANTVVTNTLEVPTINTTGTATLPVVSGVTGGIGFSEGSIACTSTSGEGCIRLDSTTGHFKVILPSGSELDSEMNYGPNTPSTFTNATTAIAANSCSTNAATVSVANLAMNGTFTVVPSQDTSSIVGWGASGGLVIDAWPSSSGVMSYKICNQSTSSITPGAVTWIIQAGR
ncbi:Uncharacterised protein [uncultured archaeon]|nr:Uncharacterised protein [uncultured archaeon]